MVVTARSDNQREETEAWLTKYLPDSTFNICLIFKSDLTPLHLRIAVFEDVYYTGAFAAMHQTEQSGQTVASMASPKKKASKADVSYGCTVVNRGRGISI